MNPLTNVKNITKLNETELASGSIHKKSWHDMYKDSAWIFIGGLQYDLTEGDILAVFSQYGEIVNINLIRDKKSGKSKGYCFLCFSNQKSTVLAVDNFNGIKLCNRTIRVDHVTNYKPPKEDERDDEITKKLKVEGCAPNLIQPSASSDVQLEVKKKKPKKEKKKKKNNPAASDSEVGHSTRIKIEKHDPGYDKYDTSANKNHHPIKRKHQESNFDDSRNEKYKSKFEKRHNRTQEKYDIQYENNHKLPMKIKQEKESSQERDSHKDAVKHTSSSKSHKRKRSSSSSERNLGIDHGRHQGEGNQSKNNHSDSRKKYKETVRSSSSSGGDDSDSTQSSSADQTQTNSKHYRKDSLYIEKRSLQKESGHKRHHRSKNSNHASNKSRHSGNIEKYAEHRSRSKYRSDDSDDGRNRNSSAHHKSKYVKR